MKTYSQFKPQISKFAGFTMIELMLTIVIAGVFMSLAVPAFQGMLSRSQVTSVTNDLIHSLMLTRNEAIKQEVNMSIVKTSGWEQGWTVVDGSGTETLTKVITESDLNIESFGAETGNSITYTAQGRSLDPLSPTNDYFRISKNDDDKCVFFTVTGRPSAGDCP